MAEGHRRGLASRTLGERPFASLHNANYRRWFSGQVLSLVGTWMQVAAQSWLVLELTHSSVDLGAVVALQQVPVLVLGGYGGVVADRVDKRRQMILLQCLMGLQALALGLITVFHVVRFWEICALAVALGVNSAFELPSRMSFTYEMVGPDEATNAVALNSVVINCARVVGPAVAGFVIAGVGVGVCFLLNAASFVAVVYALATQDRTTLRAGTPRAQPKGQFREGLRYVRTIRELWVPVVMVALIGALTYEFPVSLPVLASRTLHGDSRTYGFMYASMGLGAVVGGLVSGARRASGIRATSLVSASFGLSMLFAALSPDVLVECVALLLVGAASGAFMVTSAATMQLSAAAEMRGRAMSMWSMAYQGTTPIGAPTIGWVIGEAGARAGLLVGAASCVIGAGIGWLYTPRRSGSSAARGKRAKAAPEAAAPS